jgi:hypothetical protein
VTEANDVERARASLVQRLLARHGELEQAIVDGLRERVPDAIADRNPELTQGLPGAVAGIVQYSIATIGAGGPISAPLPEAAVEQARRAARRSVALSTVLRRYIVGYAVVERFVLKEITRAELAEPERLLLWQSVSEAQGALLDGLLVAIADEYQQELESETGSREQRRAELVHELLAGGEVTSDALGYELGTTHLALIAAGERAGEAVRWLAARVGLELLSVARGEQSVWAWIGGWDNAKADELGRLLSQDAFVSVPIALGEPSTGVAGFRLTHHQAQAARLVALRRAAPLTRYADVPLEGLALQDEILARSLIDICLGPLDEGMGHAAVLRDTLRAYFQAGNNAASAASALGVDRKTVRTRLARIEQCLDCPIGTRHTELDTALRLEELLTPPSGA